MNVTIKNIKIKDRVIHIQLDGTEPNTQVVLYDEISSNELLGKKEDTTVKFTVKSAGSALGNFELMVKEGNTYKAVEVPASVFHAIQLVDYYYDEGIDTYVRYAKSEEGKLIFSINRVRDIPGKIPAVIKGIHSGNSFIELTLDKSIVESANEYRFIIVPNKQEGMWIMPSSYDKKTGVLRAELASFIKEVELQNVVKKKWRMYIETMKEGTYSIYRISGEAIYQSGNGDTTDYFDQRDMFMNAIHSYEKEDKQLSIYPYLTQESNIALMQFNEIEKYALTVMNRLTDINYTKTGMAIDFIGHKMDGLDLKSVVVKYRTRKEDEKEMAFFPVTVKKQQGKKLFVHCDIDFSKVNIRPLYWDVRVVYEENGVEYETRLANHSASFDRKYHKDLFARKTLDLENGEIFYPYQTSSGTIAFQCRAKGAYDNIGFRLKERLAAFLYFILKPYWINKNIYLVYEKFCVMAQDNGYYFFQYCMENDMEKKLGRRIYYIMDPKSPDWDKVAKYKNRVIPFMSLKHMIYLIASKLLISTDTIDHAYAWRPKDSILHQYLDSKKLVFLQHGVIALKRVHFLYSSDKRGRCSIFVTSNNMERDIIYDYFGYKMNQIAVTGLCRWDVLEDKSEGLREVLIMPTWRNWLDEASDETFMQSDYYKNYMAFLNSERLTEYLEKYDLRLNFYLHPKFREYIGNFKIHGERLRLIPFGEEPLNELMMRCKLLVTDYSSVCWDVFYQGKPVIFYQFDAEQYEEAHGSYINFETDLFGDRVMDTEELLSLLEEYAKNEFALKEKYAKMRKDCYKYIDKNNSQRICDEIVKRGW